MSDSNSNLDDIVKSYLSTQDIYKLNDYRNSILLSISNTNGSHLVRILDEIYEKNDDPADRQKVLKLLNEVISRTENSFDFVHVVEFLSKCLKLTLCVQLSVNSIKSLLTRHFNNEDPSVYESLEKFYDMLLSKKMSQYPQQCRIDFLFISNFMLDSYLSGKIRRPDVEMMCDAVSGEKDPRNLLIMFDLLAKLAREIANEPKEFEYISNTYSIYYPIQFVPPKKDKIRITPLQLKKKLLGCFTANQELAPFSIEILLDSLYSEFSVDEQHISVISDTLYFLKRCKPLYEKHFKKFGKHLIEIIKTELLENTQDSEVERNKQMDTDTDVNNNTNSEDMKNDSNNNEDNNTNMDIDNNTSSKDNRNVDSNKSSKVKDSNSNINKDNNVLNMLDNLSVKEKKGEKNKAMDLTEVNKIGRLYYKEWKYVDEKTKLFSEIVRLFLESIGELDVIELEGFMKLLKKTMYSNYSIGYMIDVLSENSKFHSMIVDCVVLPLLEDCFKGLVDEEKNEKNMDLNSVDKINKQRDDVLNILCMYIVPKILVNFKGEEINEELILVLLRMINSNKDNKDNRDKDSNNYKILKLLLLASCVVNTDLINEEIKHLIDKVFGSNDTKDTDNDSNNGMDNTEEIMYLEILIVIYECHPDRCMDIVNMLDSMLNYDFNRCTLDGNSNNDKNNDYDSFRFNELKSFTEYIQQISHVKKNGKITNISLQINEMFKISLRRFLIDSHGNDSNMASMINTTLVEKMVLLSFRCMEFVILSRNMRSRMLKRDSNRNNNTNNNDTNMEIDRGRYTDSDSEEDMNMDTIDLENHDDTLDLCITYTSMLSMLYEFEDWSKGCEMLNRLLSREKMMEYYYGLMDYYKHSFYVDEKSTFRLIFISSKVPRILAYLARCIGNCGTNGIAIDSNKDVHIDDLHKSLQLDDKMNGIELEFLYLYYYYNMGMSRQPFMDRRIDNRDDKIKEYNSIDMFELGIDLLNVETYYMLNNGNNYNGNDSNNYYNNENKNGNNRNENEINNMFELKYFNGSILVKYVHENYSYDFKRMIEQIKMLNQYRIHNLEYDDLFFMMIPISFNQVKPILKYQMIDMRKLYKIKKKDNDNNKEDNTNMDIDNKDINNDHLLNMLYKRLKNGSYETIPSYYSYNICENMKNNKYSKVELYVSFILILLNKGVNGMKIEYLKVVIKDMNHMLDDILNWMDSNSVSENIVSEYIRWCCDKYLLYLQALLFLVLTSLNNGRYDRNGNDNNKKDGNGNHERHIFKDLFTKKLDMLIDDLVRIYKGNQVPFCRILSILTIHSIVTSKFIPMERDMRMKVIKTCSHFLGDPNKKVRGIAVLCRHQWISSMEE